MNGEYLRDYELSIWTLQDTFIDVIKWSGMEYLNLYNELAFKYPGIGQRGLILSGLIKVVNDGTEELDFSVPKFYYDGDKKISNPLWKYFEDNNFTSNMYKVKVIFNKMDKEKERVFEFVLHSVLLVHEKDEVIYDIHGVGLAFEELGKIGYKISLNGDDYEEDYKYWFEHHLSDVNSEMPLANILYWNDKIFKNTNVNIHYSFSLLEVDSFIETIRLIDDETEDIMKDYGFTHEKVTDTWTTNDTVVSNIKSIVNELSIKDERTANEELCLQQLLTLLNRLKDKEEWKYDWRYRVEMDWSSFNSYDGPRDSSKVYEETYISEWDDLNSDITYLLRPKSRENYREKSRQVDLKESNIYNLTLSIAETFGVYCRYEYEYDENYHIIGKNVIYYNNYLLEKDEVIDLIYPYTMASATRSIDSTEVISKMFVRPIDSAEASDNVITIMNVDANKSREDYLLNFDYLHDIKTITDELYAEISKYEAVMHNFNIWLMKYEFKINLLLNDANTFKAKVTYYTNAINLDDERISLALALRDELVDTTYNGNSNGAYLVRDQLNPDTLIITKTEENSKTIYSVKISTLGIVGTTILLYLNLDYTKPVKQGRLNTPVKSFEIVTDEFGAITKITNIVFSGSRDNGGKNVLYATYEYSPRLYYDNVAKVWESRKAQDTLDKALTELQLTECYLLLYGADTDFALVDYATVGYTCAGFGRAGEDIALYLNERPNVSTATYLANVGANAGYARADMGETNDGHAYVYEHEVLLDKKNKEINSFERMIGPALREGYWLPDNYNDYGNQFNDDFELTSANLNGNSINGSTNSDLISLIWDEEKFEEESGLTYKIGTDTQTEPYLIVNLSGNIDKITGNLDDLRFIYYDKEITTLISELNGNSTLSDELKAEEKERLKRKALRSYSIHSMCEFGYVLSNIPGKLKKITPVLIVTGITELSNDLLNFMLNLATSEYKPFIGQITTTVNDSYVVETNIIPLIKSLQYFNEFSNNKLKLKNLYSIRDNKSCNNATTFDYGRYFPRLQIKSLEMKTDSTNFLLNVNGKNLEMYEDYYILVRSILEQLENDGYYVTIKPEALLLAGNNNINISVSYCVSNADIAIYLDALKVMKENSKPKVSYEVKLNLLNERLIQTAYKLLNHIVHINDVEMNFENIQGYISSFTLDLDNPSNDTFEIKNYETKFEDLFSTIVAETESMKKNENALTSAANAFSLGIIKGDIILDSLLRTDLNYRFNSGKLTIDEANGILGISDEGIVAFRGGGIFTATEKNERGDWIWNTGLLPSGLNASLITSGQLDTNKIKIYAGNKVKFLLNGEGLFAYRSLFSEEAVTDAALYYVHNALTTNGDIDASLYVTFNDAGLFLVAKQGALVLSEDKIAYHLMTKDVNRVEVSWNGLIIRDVEGNNVFYADEQGNLTLKSTIYAKAGEIGGWTITDTALRSENILLYSQMTNGMAGIYLTASERTAGDLVKYNGIDFWAYRKNNDSTNYYVNEFNNSLKRSSSHTVLSYLDYRVGVKPKYLIQVEIEGDPTIGKKENYTGSNPAGEDEGDTNSYTYSGQLSTPNKTTIMCLANSSNTTLSYNGNYISYNYDTSINADWYTKLKLARPNDYTSYVDDIMNNGLLTVSTNVIPLNTTLTLYSFEPNFSVVANTGAMTVNNGTIGDFTITSTHLANGTLNAVKIRDNSIVIPRPSNSTTDLSLSKYKDCFVDITGDSENGNLIFWLVSGSTVNFNIASMKAFLKARADAGALTLHTAYHNNDTCVVIVKSGYGNTWTHTEGISDVYSHGYNKGKKEGYDSGWGAVSGVEGDRKWSSSGNTIVYTSTVTLSNKKKVTCGDANTDFGPERYKAGYSAASGVATRSKPSNYYSLDPGGSWSITVPSGDSGTRTISIAVTSGGCFIAGTPVTLKNGSTIPIELITVLEEIIAYDEIDKTYKPAKVISVQAFEHKNNIADIILSSGKIITLTKSHPILTVDGWKALDIDLAKKEHYIENISLLKINDQLVNYTNEKIYVSNIIERDDLLDTTVYNIDIEPYDTYVINDIVVHNADSKT